MRTNSQATREFAYLHAFFGTSIAGLSEPGKAGIWVHPPSDMTIITAILVGLEYEAAARVAGAAHRLSQLRLAQGDPDGAIDASRAGLRLAFDDELIDELLPSWRSSAG